MARQYVVERERCSYKELCKHLFEILKTLDDGACSRCHTCGWVEVDDELLGEWNNCAKCECHICLACLTRAGAVPGDRVLCKPCTNESSEDDAESSEGPENRESEESSGSESSSSDLSSWQ